MAHAQGDLLPTLQEWFKPGERVLWIGSVENPLVQPGSYQLEHLTLSQLFEARTVPDGVQDGGRVMVSNSERRTTVPEWDGVFWRVSPDEFQERGAFEIAYRLKQIVRPGGVVVIHWAGQQIPGSLANSEFSLLLERLGFSSSAVHDGGSVGVFRHTGDTGSRAVDRIESILSKDRKVATYKLALLRALSEIAQSGYHSVLWREGRVWVPLERIAELWLFYYWPIFSSADFIPQIQNEGADSARQVKFRRAMTELINEYRHGGGLTAFYSSYFGNDSVRSSSLVRSAIRDISQTIVSGPVTHAGGGSNPIFSEAIFGSSKYVGVPPDIWRELTLLSAWISDAVIVRWIEKTAELCGGLGEGRIIKALLERPAHERTTSVARVNYAEWPDLHCVWSGRRLSANAMHVDHLMPYALWRNNDLWNLVPAAASVNASKSDLLPTREKLLESKGRILSSWEWTRDRCDSRFDAELSRALGCSVLGADWRKAAFDFVQEAVEITATQRVVGRWPAASVQL